MSQINKHIFPKDPSNPNEFFSYRSPETRIINLQTSHPAIHLLHEIGVINIGIDFLENFYRAGLLKSYDHLLYFIVKGSTWIECENQRKKVGKLKVGICPVGSQQIIELASKSCTAIWFHISDSERWTAIREGGFRILESHESENLEYCIKQILRELTSPQHGSDEVAKHFAQLIITYLDRELESLDRPAHRQIKYKLFQLWDEVIADLSLNWTVNLLAKKIHVSSGYLHRVLLQHEGMKPMEKVTQLRMQRAADLLKNTYYTLDQIAEMVGYGTPYSFSNAFLRFHKKRPGIYRKKHGRKINSINE